MLLGTLGSNKKYSKNTLSAAVQFNTPHLQSAKQIKNSNPSSPPTIAQSYSLFLSKKMSLATCPDGHQAWVISDQRRE